MVPQRVTTRHIFPRERMADSSTVHFTCTSQSMLNTLKPFATGMDIVFSCHSSSSEDNYYHGGFASMEYCTVYRSEVEMA
jgi:hypothetical protein